MKDWYSAFDALLLTSQNEGTPGGRDRGARGRPARGRDRRGWDAHGRPGRRSGYLAPIGDTAALGARLAELARDRGLAARLAAHGAADVRARFSLERMTDDVEALYREALAR